MRTGPVVCGVALSLALSGCALRGGDQGAEPTPPERGRTVALQLCAACHAVERNGVSPQVRAPAFDSREMQHTAGLTGRVADLTRLGHYGMPSIPLSGPQVDDMVAYIESLGDGDRR